MMSRLPQLGQITVSSRTRFLHFGLLHGSCLTGIIYSPSLKTGNHYYYFGFAKKEDGKTARWQGGKMARRLLTIYTDLGLQFRDAYCVLRKTKYVIRNTFYVSRFTISYYMRKSNLKPVLALLPFCRLAV
jgi:hypothetical protein